MTFWSPDTRPISTSSTASTTGWPTSRGTWSSPRTGAGSTWGPRPSPTTTRSRSSSWHLMSRLSWRHIWFIFIEAVFFFICYYHYWVLIHYCVHFCYILANNTMTCFYNDLQYLPWLWENCQTQNRQHKTPTINNQCIAQDKTKFSIL